MYKYATPPPTTYPVLPSSRRPSIIGLSLLLPPASMESGNVRINSARMPQYVGRHVRLTGKVIKTQGETIIVQASDGGQVEVKLSGGRQIQDNFIEILGKVVDAQRMTASEIFPQGENLDLEVVDQLVELMHKHPEIYM